MTSKSFIISFLFSIIVFIFVNKVIFYKTLTSPDNFRISPLTNTLVIGASQGRLGINPDLFNSMENVCVLGEIHLLTEKKLRLILSHPNSIEKVILPISPITFTFNREYNNFNKESDIGRNVMYEYLFQDDSIGEFIHIDLFVTKRRNKYKLGITPPNKEEWSALFNHYVKGQSLTITHPSWGGYDAEFRSDLNTEYLLEAFFYFNGEISEYSPLQVKYLHKIIDLCLQYNKQLILIGMPAAQLFRDRTPNFHKKEFDSLISSCIEQNPSIKYVNYSNTNIADSLFLDAVHLNNDGSIYLAKTLKDSI